MPDRLNAWTKLPYEDPQVVLTGLTAAATTLTELQASGVELDPKTIRLRTSTTKQTREWRDAALFTYGIGRRYDRRIYFAPGEGEDFDFMTAWTEGDQTAFCPVQLKELPPADLNPTITLSEIIASVQSKYATASEAVLAVKLSKKPGVDLLSLRTPDVPFREVYLFWANSPDSSTFVLWGDLKANPEAFEYSYPV